MATILELRQRRAQVISEARQVAERATKEARDLTGEEQVQIDRAMTAADDLMKQVTTLERLDASERTLSDSAGRRVPPVDDRSHGRDDVPVNSTKEYAAAFRRYMTHRDTRGLVAGTNASGGYFLTPTQLADQFIEAKNNFTFMRQMATIETVVGSGSLGIPQLTADVDDFDWTTEVASVTADTGYTLARRDLTPTALTKSVDVSVRLLMRSPQAASRVVNSLAKKFAYTEEKGYLTGTGTAQPLGVFVASASGITTARDTIFASATVLDYATLIAAKMSLKQQYLASKSFGIIAHRDFVKKCLQLLDSQNRPIFDAGDQVGMKDTLMGMPIMYSEFAPATFTTGLYVAVLGDFSYYTIAEVSDAFYIQRADELKMLTNQVVFKGYNELDGSPVLAEAFTRLRML